MTIKWHASHASYLRKMPSIFSFFPPLSLFRCGFFKYLVGLVSSFIQRPHIQLHEQHISVTLTSDVENIMPSNIGHVQVLATVRKAKHPSDVHCSYLCTASPELRSPSEKDRNIYNSQCDVLTHVHESRNGDRAYRGKPDAYITL